MTRATVDLPVGYRIPIPRFHLDRENIARFHYVLHHMETGEDRPGKNIHTDYEFARGRGLPDVMADGSQTVAESPGCSPSSSARGSCETAGW